MSRVWTVARRELRGFFDHPTAYILVVAFLALTLFLTFRSVYAAGAATLRPLFSLLPWLFAVFIPAVTMRSLAEERRSGTLEWLLAHPLGEGEVVLGKFLGNWLFVLAVLAGTLPTAAGVLLVSEADPGIVVAQYVGASLLALQMVGIGLWASSATRNQITAFILAMAVSFALALVGTQVVLVGLPPVLAGAVARLSVIGHFENVARGVIDLRDVLYFLTTGGLFLALAYALLLRERLSPRRGAYRRLRLGIGAVAAGVLVLNLLGGHIRGRLDLTRENLYTLAPGTREILGRLEDIVTVKLVVSRELPPEVQLTLRDVRDLVADFRRAARGKIRVEELHPDDDEDAAAEAASLGVRPIQFNVLRGDELEVKRGWLGLAVLFADKREVIPVIERTDDLEYRLAAQIAAMTAERKPRLAFVTGYGARSSFDFSAFRQSLGERFEIRTVNLEGDSLPELSPDSIDVIVVAGPREEMDTAAVERIRGYLDAGGGALILVDRNDISPQMPVSRPVTTGLEELLEERGVRVGSGMVYDLRSNERVTMGRRGIFTFVRPYPLWPVVFRAAEHPTTRNLDHLSLAWASPVEVVDSARVRPLWRTTEMAGVRASGSTIAPDAPFSPDPEEFQVEVVAAAVAPAEDGEEGNGGGPPGRIIVVGDANFLEDQFVQANPQNAIFAANALDWLAQDEALIRIRSKDRTPPALVFDSPFQKNALKWGNLVGVPLLFALGGVVRVTGRRRRAERRWEEVGP